MSYIKEREVLTELIEIYRESQCLWDLSSSAYKDAKMKKTAWDKLLQKYKDFDPNANEATVKKKIDNLKTSYQREAKKVKESKNRTGVAASDIHRPNLWYYELMTFLDKKNELNKTAVDSIMSENEDVLPIHLPLKEPQIGTTKRQKMTREYNLKSKQEKLMDTALALLKTDIKTEPNPFGLYVGQQIKEISPGLQRHVAEKLICDIIFLAKTNRLTFDTKIDIPSSTCHHSSQNFDQHNPYVKQSPPSNQIALSPQASSDISSNSPPYQDKPIQSPPYSSHTQHPLLQISVPATSPSLPSSIPMESHSSFSHSHSDEPLLLTYLKKELTDVHPEFV